MKKSTFVVVVVLALALCVPAVAFAALSPSSPMAIGSRSAAATCPNYADRNANGACDRHENGVCPGYTDADGDGVCDNYAAPRSNGKAAPDNGDASASDDAAAPEAPAQEAPAPKAAPRQLPRRRVLWVCGCRRRRHMRQLCRCWSELPGLRGCRR